MPPKTQAFSLFTLPSSMPWLLLLAYRLIVSGWLLLLQILQLYSRQTEQGRAVYEILSVLCPCPLVLITSVQWPDFQLLAPAFLCLRVFSGCLSKEEPALLPTTPPPSNTQSRTKESGCKYSASLSRLGKMILRQLFILLCRVS